MRRQIRAGHEARLQHECQGRQQLQGRSLVYRPEGAARGGKAELSTDAQQWKDRDGEVMCR